MATAAGLTALLSRYGTVSVVGIAKNVGKTTTLNHLIEGFGREGLCLGLTGIGRDGESVDVVTGTAKPRIFVRAGTIVATAADLLVFCDITKEILAVTDIGTPMGGVVIVRALSDGFVQLGGASITSQVAGITALMRGFGAEKTIVDGAVDRRALANVTESAVLCAGASLRGDMDSVVSETAHVVGMMTLPQADISPDVFAVEPLDKNERIVRIDEGTICLRGAVTDGVVEGLGTELEGVRLVAEDPGKIFVRPAAYARLLRRKAALMVARPANLVAVTVNPVSAYGGRFDAREFLDRMRGAVAVPVFDVMGEEGI